MDKNRKKKFGIICNVRIDHDDPEEDIIQHTGVYRKDRTPNRPDYLDLMSNGGEGWRREHSDRGLLEWGTPIDYLGHGTKLMLYDTDISQITVIADIVPDACYIHNENHVYEYRNIIKDGSLCVLSEPISLDDIKKVEGLEKFPYRRWKDISESQFQTLIKGKKCTNGKVP